MVSTGDEEMIKDLLKEVVAILADDWEGRSAEEEVSPAAEGNNDHLVMSCAQALFTILDHVRAWLRAKYAALLQATGKLETQLKAEDMRKASRNMEYCLVRRFLDRITDVSLANLSFVTGSYHRQGSKYKFSLPRSPVKNDIPIPSSLSYSCCTLLLLVSLLFYFQFFSG